MSYSDQNPAWDRMKKGQHDARIQWEAQYANDLQANQGMSRSDALKKAAELFDALDARNGESANAPVRRALGTKVVITDKTMQAIENSHRSINAFPSNSYMEKAREVHAKKLVGEVTHLFPPGYEVNVTFSNGTILQMKDHWIETLESAPELNESAAPSL